MLPLEAGTIVTYPKPDFSSPIKLVDENYVQETENVEANTLMKNLALFVSLLNLLISIYMWFQFDNSSTSYQFVYEFNNLNFCHFHVGVDGISLYFVVRLLKESGKFLIRRNKSSNSGDYLKLLIPSLN